MSYGQNVLSEGVLLGRSHVISVAGSPKVLLLEDDSSFSDMLQDYLQAESFEVTCVPSGVEGLRQTMATDFDAILCDMVMPNVPGDMFYLAVQRTKPHLCKRFIFMTGYSAEPKINAFLCRVQGPVLLKPFHKDDLMAFLQIVLHHNNPRKN